MSFTAIPIWACFYNTSINLTISINEEAWALQCLAQSCNTLLALVLFSFFPVQNPEASEWHCELCVSVCLYI